MVQVPATAAELRSSAVADFSRADIYADHD
jgi:hypothetical protein